MYDPLVHSYPPSQIPAADSYWRAMAPQEQPDDGTLASETRADVAIIGGGYTGLSAALELTRHQGLRAVVLEARSAAWGCSGRNGSFARISGGRMPHAALIAQFGEATARAFFDELRAGLDTVRRLIEEGGIDCDRQPDGVYKVATFAPHAEKLQAEVELYNRVFGYPARFIQARELDGIHGGPEAFGALHLPDGFAMNPLKLAHGLQRMARAAGATVHSDSPVIGWTTQNGLHTLRTPGGSVTAPKVIVATNGYTSNSLHPRLSSRVLPVHSQIIVTTPMSDAQVRASIPTDGCLFDTRELLFYYRRLPDNRVLFGGRSAISGADSTDPKHRAYLYNAMVRKFPALAGIGIDHWWGGWVAVTRNSLPFFYQVPGLEGAFWGGGYAGSGVSFSMHAGTRLAQMAAGLPVKNGAAFLTQEPARYPFGRFLRIGQTLAYRWLHHKDARLAATS
ncbi:FAD-dependent oxidoreductase [Paracoccus sp. DK608]|uniref:FAD-dependent oxidoreductase n=1 Tax=Paracoccus shanxieyensis TaxID=2675752 RepID=A0A6L6IY57_9RHOB|nr:FAD-dependent oxidoreductase [Paracoccus shanxieyensis]MTH86959.1 FAD-dependent oxidoreductase [Paracoccus shanxieyensis]